METCVIVHICNPSTQKAEAGRSGVWDQSGLQNELQDSLSLKKKQGLGVQFMEDCLPG
jgi:hypothetical protein